MSDEYIDYSLFLAPSLDDEELFSDYSSDPELTTDSSNSSTPNSPADPASPPLIPGDFAESPSANESLEELQTKPDYVHNFPELVSVAKEYSLRFGSASVFLVPRKGRVQKRKSALNAYVKKFELKEKRTSKPSSRKGEGQLYFTLPYTDIHSAIEKGKLECEFLSSLPRPADGAPVLPEKATLDDLYSHATTTENVMGFLPFGPAVQKGYTAHVDTDGITLLASGLGPKRKTAQNEEVSRYGFLQKRTGGQVYFRLRYSTCGALVADRTARITFLNSLLTYLL